MATTHASERLYMKWKDTKDPMASTSLGGLGRRGGANLQRRKETTTTTITTTTTTTTRSVSVSSSTKTNKTKARHVPGEYSPASPQVIALSIGKSEAERIRESVQYIRHKKSRRRGARRARYDDDDDDEDEDDSDDTSSSSRDSSKEEGSEVGNGDGESAGEDEKEGSNALKVTKSNGNSFDENRAPRRHRRRHRHRRVAGNEKDDAEEYESDPYMLITILVVWSLIVYYLLQTQYIGRLLIEVARPLIILATFPTALVIGLLYYQFRPRHAPDNDTAALGDTESDVSDDSGGDQTPRLIRGSGEQKRRSELRRLQKKRLLLKPLPSHFS